MDREILDGNEEKIIKDLNEIDAKDCADELKKSLDKFEGIGKVIHALDLYLSGDRGKDSFQKALAEWRKNESIDRSNN